MHYAPPPAHHHAQVSFQLREVNLPRWGGHNELIRFPDHKALEAQIREGAAYASSHAGRLPDNVFWQNTVRVYEANERLFARLHQCGGLLSLLHNNLEAESRVEPVVPPPDRPPGVVKPFNLPPPGAVTPFSAPPSVPEPPSVLMLSVALIAGGVFRLLRG